MKDAIKNAVIVLTVFCLSSSVGCSDDSPGARCGDNVINTSRGEECDSHALGGMRCTDLEQGFYGGVLGCYPAGHASECLYDTSQCTGPECGNGIVDQGEECDGFDMGGQSCLSLNYDGGQLACFAPDTADECTLDESGCRYSPFCGDNITDPGEGEECDGNDLSGETCQTQGYIGGSLRCTQDCLFDHSQCTTPVCGNDTREATEICDGPDLGGETCITRGYIQGNLDCEADCSAFIETGCSGTPVCGNDVAEGLESCDGTDLNNTACQDLGYLFGDLACHPQGHANECEFDESNCVGSGNCTVDIMVGILQSGVPEVVNGDLTTAADNHVLSCDPLMGMFPAPDQVMAFSINENGTLTLEYSLSGIGMLRFGLFQAGSGNCTDNEVGCQEASGASGTLDFGFLNAGTYYVIAESMMPSPYTATLNFTGAEICDNNIDDNGNGLTDCEEGLQCCGEAHCQTNPDYCLADGVACTTDASCAGSICLDENSTGFPGGLCTSDCLVTLLCSNNFVCMNYSSTIQAVCAPPCPNGLSSDCRTGYLCYDLGAGDMICLPDCTNNSQCPDVGTCDVPSGLCGSSTGLAADGQACTTYDDCAGAACFTETGFGAPGGYCSSLCSLANPVCPGDGVCVDYDLTPADNGYCFDGCTVTGDCRGGTYTCSSNPHNPPPTDDICVWP